MKKEKDSPTLSTKEMLVLRGVKCEDSGFGAQGLGLGVQGLVYRVQGFGVECQGLGWRWALHTRVLSQIEKVL